MRRLWTAVIAVAGAEANACIRSLDDARNVRVIQPNRWTTISNLSHSRWWPDLTELPDQIELALPDRPMTANAGEAVTSSGNDSSGILLSWQLTSGP